MAGLVPAIHVFAASSRVADARVNPGDRHDDKNLLSIEARTPTRIERERGR